MLISYWDLVADYYSAEWNKTLVISASGAPGLPAGGDATAGLRLSAGYDLVCPQYYGFGASKWEFTPSNCIQTILDTKKTFQWWKVFNIFGWENLDVFYDRFIVIGKSFGGLVASMIPRFDSSIDTIGLFYPLLSWLPLNDPSTTEETTEQFVSMIKNDLSPLYRWIDNVEREDYLNDSSDLIPYKNFAHLKDVKIFAVHGSADPVIYSMRTKEFVGLLNERNPNGNYKYEEYYGLSHGWSMKTVWTEWMIHWLESEKK